MARPPPAVVLVTAASTPSAFAAVTSPLKPASFSQPACVVRSTLVSFSTVKVAPSRGSPEALASSRPLPAAVPLVASLTSLWMVMEPVLDVSRSTSEGARSTVAARPKAGAAWVAEVAAGRASAPAATAKAASRLRLRRVFVVLIGFLSPVCVISGVFSDGGSRGHGTSWVAQAIALRLLVVTTVITIAPVISTAAAPM